MGSSSMKLYSWKASSILWHIVGVHWTHHGELWALIGRHKVRVLSQPYAALAQTPNMLPSRMALQQAQA
jgi:hypothetical protein